LVKEIKFDDGWMKSTGLTFEQEYKEKVKQVEVMKMK
jgi:hypothetical protein